MTNLYSVSYNVNNATGGSTPPTQMAESNSDTYTFITPAAQEYGLIKTNHGFAGWSKNPNATTPEYKAGSTINLSNTSPNITLYAVWINLSPVTSWDDLKYMQQMSPSACSGGNETGKQLIDFRDGKSYWVAKLKDDNCWMTQNLDLDLNGVTLTPTDSNVNTDWTSTTGPSVLWNSSNNDEVKYYDPGERYCPSGNCTTEEVNTSSNNGHDAQGNYYSWCAATAGCKTPTNQESTVSINSPSSICPKGWNLPLGGSSNGLAPTAVSGSFGLLLNKQLGLTSTNTADSSLLKEPLYFIRGGRVYNGSLSYTGERGYYWTATTDNDNEAYRLGFLYSGVYISDASERSYGFSVRCVAK